MNRRAPLARIPLTHPQHLLLHPFPSLVSLVTLKAERVPGRNRIVPVHLDRVDDQTALYNAYSILYQRGKGENNGSWKRLLFFFFSFFYLFFLHPLLVFLSFVCYALKVSKQCHTAIGWVYRRRAGGVV